jgi:hypothetical protein
MRSEPNSQTPGRQRSVEPSRAWILGLLVDADGSVLDPLPAEPEWPAPAHDQITPQDGPPVRP